MATATKKKKAKKPAEQASEMMDKAGKEARERVAHLAKSVVDFEKTTFDSTAKMAGKMQERSEKLLLDVVDHADWMAPEIKKAVHEWVKMMRRSRGDFKKTMDKSFTLMNQYIVRMEKPEKGKAHASANGRKKPAKRKSTSAAKKRRAPRKRSTAAAAAA